LTRMGLPLEPVVTDEDMVKPLSTGSLRGVMLGPIRVAEENLESDEGGGEESDEELIPVESEE
jgi:hypothetical protein